MFKYWLEESRQNATANSMRQYVQKTTVKKKASTRGAYEPRIVCVLICLSVCVRVVCVCIRVNAVYHKVYVTQPLIHHVINCGPKHVHIL